MISIITPSYNNAKEIEACILSVKEQNYPKLEHIIVDGGSQDETVQILKKYSNQYNLLWVSEKDNGIADAMNKGFKMAHGEIFSWLDADNYFASGIVKTVAEIFKKNNVDIVYGNINIINYDGSASNVYCPPQNISIETAMHKNTGGIPAQPGTFFKKSIFHYVNGFDSSYRVASDVDFWFRVLSLQPKLLYKNIIFGSYRLKENATSQSAHGVWLGLKEMLIICKKNRQSTLMKILLIKKYVGGYLKTIINNNFKK